jgi:acyl-CoA reductase-like NAD-dependent aldehyde dehydrogenase
MVHVNGATVQDEPHVPFGGMGASGFGRESTDPDLEVFTEWKWVTLQA